MAKATNSEILRSLKKLLKKSKSPRRKSRRGSSKSRRGSSKTSTSSTSCGRTKAAVLRRRLEKHRKGSSKSARTGRDLTRKTICGSTKHRRAAMGSSRSSGGRKRKISAYNRYVKKNFKKYGGDFGRIGAAWKKSKKSKRYGSSHKRSKKSKSRSGSVSNTRTSSLYRRCKKHLKKPRVEDLVRKTKKAGSKKMRLTKKDGSSSRTKNALCRSLSRSGRGSKILAKKVAGKRSPSKKRK